MNENSLIKGTDAKGKIKQRGKEQGISLCIQERSECQKWLETSAAQMLERMSYKVMLSRYQ